MIILTAVDVAGFMPTFRKSWHWPREESLTFFGLMIARNVIAAIALEHYSWTTLLFPLTTAVFRVAFIIMVFLRRRVDDGGPIACLPEPTCLGSAGALRL